MSKQILVSGDAAAGGPEKGDEVHVHYVGTLLDGSKFDSSRDRDSPFSFTLGQGSVIKGWDIGVATMTKGEKCILTCTAPYAYGQQGSPPKIPGGATLQFEVELLDWDSKSDLIKDGGVIKKVIADVTSWEQPKERDEVFIKYKIWRDGFPDAIIASSDSTSFTLSSPPSEVPKGFKPALLTMKRGEISQLKLKPAYGFSEGNLPDGISLEDKLEAAIELLRWNKVEDVTEDGLVIRKVVQAAPDDDWKHPNEGAKVTIKLALLGEDAVEVAFITDEGQAPASGIELAVMKMKRGEKDEVTILDTKTYGPASSSAEKLVYSIELIEFEAAKETWEMTDAEKVAAATVKKDKANKEFKEGNLVKASKLYDKAISSISYDKNMPDDVKILARDVRKTCQLNLAAVHLKTKDFKKVVENCSKVIEIDGSNVKALYRRAQAYCETQDFLEAEVDIKAAILLEPANADLVALQKKIKVSSSILAKKEGAMFAKMFK